MRRRRWRLDQVQRRRDSIFYYILFLRVTPLIPNFMVNMVAPIADIPLVPYFFGTLLGIAPQAFIACQLGQTLGELTETSVSPWSIVLLIVLGFVVLALAYFKERLRRRAKVPTAMDGAPNGHANEQPSAM